MPTRIRKLTCKIRVRSGRKASLLHKPEKAPHPVMEFAMPAVESAPPGQPAPSQTATQERGGATGEHKAKPSARRADPKAVADRVYELMRQEILDAQRRGAGRH